MELLEVQVVQIALFHVIGSVLQIALQIVNQINVKILVQMAAQVEIVKGFVLADAIPHVAQDAGQDVEAAVVIAMELVLDAEASARLVVKVAAIMDAAPAVHLGVLETVAGHAHIH